MPEEEVKREARKEVVIMEEVMVLEGWMQVQLLVVIEGVERMEVEREVLKNLHPGSNAGRMVHCRLGRLLLG